MVKPWMLYISASLIQLLAVIAIDRGTCQQLVVIVGGFVFMCTGLILDKLESLRLELRASRGEVSQQPAT